MSHVLIGVIDICMLTLLIIIPITKKQIEGRAVTKAPGNCFATAPLHLQMFIVNFINVVLINFRGNKLLQENLGEMNNFPRYKFC